MFAKLHLLSQDVPEGGEGFRWRAHPYLRMAGAVPKGPVVFDWSPRQRTDLEALWRDPATEGARERLAQDLAGFCDKLGWAPDAEQLEQAEKHGDEYMLTLSAVPSELYLLPWEVIQVGATATYLSDYASALVRYAMPGLEPRELQTVPPAPGVLFAWSGAGGPVPHEEQAAAIRAAAEAGGVAFRELAEVDDASLQEALDAGPPSVLHLLCHGLPGQDGEPSRIRWGKTDQPSEITGPRLARMLRHHHESIRLVVLSTCGGGDGHGDPMRMGSIAQELHRAGITGVVASRYPLSVPGSRVMTRALYDKLLREAWSLERALRATREAMFRADETGETHPGDAYGLQLYAHDTEWFVSDNNVEAERPVLASYPFGTADRPVPAKGPPPAELTLSLEAHPGLSEDELVARLQRLSEDKGLVIVIQKAEGRGAVSLVVNTTMDGAQRLLSAWRSKTLRVAVGAIIGTLVLTKGINAVLGATLTAAAGPSGAAAGLTGAAAGQGGGVVAPAAAVGTGKVATAAVTIASKAIIAKIAVAAVISSVAVAGGAVVYEVQKQPPAAQSPTAAGIPGDPAESPKTIEPDRPVVADGTQPSIAAPPPVSPTPQPSIAVPPPVSPTPKPIIPAREARPLPPPTAPTAATVAAPHPATAPASSPEAVAAPPSTPPAPLATAPKEEATAGSQPPIPSAVGSPPPSEPGSPPPSTPPGSPPPSTPPGSPPPSTRPGSPRPSTRPASQAPVSVDPSVMAAHRSSGDTDVRLSRQTKDSMHRNHVDSLKAVVQLCVDATGLVTDSALTARAGYTEFDSRVIEAVRGWQYQPYLVDGAPVAMCSTVDFVYHLPQ